MTIVRGPVRVLLALAVLLLAACGGDEPSPESVVRAWSQAVNADDDEAAARLFARDARVVQGEDVHRLRTFAQARAWNASLRCSGRIVALRANGETVRATFVLGNRRRSKCDGPGERAHALFHVRGGKIVLWHQLDAPDSAPEESV